MLDITSSLIQCPYNLLTIRLIYAVVTCVNNCNVGQLGSFVDPRYLSITCKDLDYIQSGLGTMSLYNPGNRI